MKETADFFNDTGAKLASEGLHNEAVACLKKGLVLEPYNYLLWFNLGLSYYALNRQNDCKAALFQSIRCNPFDADAWDSLGIILHELGEPDAAKEAYEQALDFEPDTGRIWNNYGTLLFNQKRYKEARRAFETAVTLDPDFAYAVLNLRDTYLEMGQYDLAKTCTDILAEKWPDIDKA